MELVSVTDVKVSLQIDAEEKTHDELLNLLISGYSALIERFCNRTFVLTSYDEDYDGNNSDTLMLDNYPVVSVSSLKIDSIPYVSDDYKVYSDGEIRMVDGSIFTKGDQNVEVEYTAGFEAIPEDVQMCCIQLVSLKFKTIDSNRIGIASESVGDQNVSFTTSEFPNEIKDILKSYRKIPT